MYNFGKKVASLVSIITCTFGCRSFALRHVGWTGLAEELVDGEGLRDDAGVALLAVGRLVDGGVDGEGLRDDAGVALIAVGGRVDG